MVLGEIPELGKWHPEEGLLLKHVRDNYWVSSTVMIPSNTDVRYKYVLHNKAKPENSLWEGHGEYDNRRLTEFPDVFDVWNNNSTCWIDWARMECAFIYGIFQSLDPDTDEQSQSDHNDIPSHMFKNAVMKYQSLLKQQHDLALASVSAEKIAQIVQDMPSPTWLLAFILLGYSIEKARNLPVTFPSGHLLSCLPQFKEEMLPSGTNVNVRNIVDALVLHNSQSGSYDWMIMFGLSEAFGSRWTDSVRSPRMASHPDSFKYAFDRYAVPNVAVMYHTEKASTLKVIMTWRFSLRLG